MRISCVRALAHRVSREQSGHVLAGHPAQPQEPAHSLDALAQEQGAVEDLQAEAVHSDPSQLHCHLAQGGPVLATQGLLSCGLASRGRRR